MKSRQFSRCLAIVLIFFLVSLYSCIPLVGQQAVNSATVSGIVEDQSGAVVASASVTIRNLDRNQSATVSTDENGRFRFLYQPVGSYELQVERSGFALSTARLTLSVGQALEVPVKLSVTGVTAEVNVGDDLPSIELVRTELAETIVPKEIDTLPLNGRNYLDLALLVPGVSKTNTGTNERFAETSAVPGTGISVAGQRNLGNGFVVDGLSANDDAADLAGTFFSQEVIREFQVVTSGGIAEFGRASSGVVNIVTQSGTNAWRGKLYGFLRNQRFDGTNIFAAVNPSTGQRLKSPLTQGQYGLSLGGPLRRDKTFLFANFEREDLHRSGFVTILPANIAVINPVLDGVGYLPPRLTAGEYPTGDTRTSFFSKADLKVNDDHQLSVRYSLYDITSPNARNIGGLSAVSRGTVVADRDQTVAVNDVRTLSAKSVNEARFQLTHSRFLAPGNDVVGPAVSISGVANFGASTSSPTLRDIDLLEVADNLSRIEGSHSLKTGLDLLYNRVNIVFPATLYGAYGFSSLASFQTGAYTTFGQAFGKVDWFQTNPNLGWFGQDEWKPRGDLTINAGVRYDLSWMADHIRTRRNLSPRMGLAYAPGDHHTVLRAGAGLYYDRIPLRAVANALRGAGTDYKSISLQRTQVGAPAFPGKLAAFPAGTLFNLATIDPAIKNGAGFQANLQIEHEFTSRTSVSAGYLHMRGLHIIMQRNLNVPSLTAAQDPINLGRPDSGFGNITQYSGQGDSYYDGFTFSLQQRARKWGSARLSYTFSKAIDDTGNAFFNSPQDNFNLRNDRGLSDNDQRHHLTVSGQITVPRTGLQLSPILTHASPYPFNIVTGGQTLQTTAARLPGVGRNTGVGFDADSLDLRLSRQFHPNERYQMEFIAESFNTLNRTNLQFPNNTYGTGVSPLPTFGAATGAADPRQIQFGVRLSF